MLNLSAPITLTSEQMQIIRGFGSLSVEHWNRNKTKLKTKISADLKKLQDDRCVYCGCKVYGTGDVEHIANKATHTEFLFTPKNLAYACKSCNQTYKGATEVVVKSDPDYEKCSFSIVHPYLDDVDYFFDTTQIILKPRKTLVGDELKKATATMELLKWESPEVTYRRAREVGAKLYALEHGTTITEMVYENILTFIP